MDVDVVKNGFIGAKKAWAAATRSKPELETRIKGALDYISKERPKSMVHLDYYYNPKSVRRSVICYLLLPPVPKVNDNIITPCPSFRSPAVLECVLKSVTLPALNP